VVHLMWILKYFRHPRLAVVRKSIARSGDGLAHFGLIFAVIFGTYTIMANLFFGQTLENYHTFSWTLQTGLLMVLGDFDYWEIQRTWALGTYMFFWTFIILVSLILFNMVIGIVFVAYDKETENRDDSDFYVDLRNEVWRCVSRKAQEAVHAADKKAQEAADTADKKAQEAVHQPSRGAQKANADWSPHNRKRASSQVNIEVTQVSTPTSSSESSDPSLAAPLVATPTSTKSRRKETPAPPPGYATPGTYAQEEEALDYLDGVIVRFDNSLRDDIESEEERRGKEEMLKAEETQEEEETLKAEDTLRNLEDQRHSQVVII